MSLTNCSVAVFAVVKFGFFRMKPAILISLTLLAALAFSAAAQPPGAHVHGVAKLDVAVDGGTLTLTLESPLDNLLGFEHLPRNDKQKAAVRAMAERLNRAGELFVPTAAAGCTATSVKLASPVLEPAKTGGDGHNDLDGEFVFSCAKPQALRDIDVKLFAAFPHLRQLDVAVVTGRGQSAARLTPQQTRVSW